MSGEIETRYIPTEHQVADIFTKAFTTARFRFLCAKLKLVNSPQFSLRGDVKVKADCSRNKASALVIS